MELLVDRNLTTHAYDEEKAAEVEKLIHQKILSLTISITRYFKKSFK